MVVVGIGLFVDEEALERLPLRTERKVVFRPLTEGLGSPKEDR